MPGRSIQEAYADLSARGFSCGCPVPPFGEVFPGTGTCGYAMRPTEEGMQYVCIPCAEEAELQAFLSAEVCGCYLSSDGRALTTWTGKQLARVTQEWSSRGGFGAKLTHVRAVDSAGRRWYGKGSGRGMCLTVRRAKGQVAA
jgi:hypothetical protein